MANNRITLENAWYNFIAIEDKYYEVMARYDLLTRGINYPEEKQVRERVDYLSHIFLRISHCLGKQLTKRELRCIYEASCGKGTKEIAESTGLSEGVIRKHQHTAFRKLRTQKVAHAVQILNNLGYLPLDLDNQEILLPFKAEEAENASA